MFSSILPENRFREEWKYGILGEMSQTPIPRRILIVEDEKMLSKAMDLHFQKHGFETIVCYDGQTAIDILGQQTFDAVLLDLILPGRDGYAVLEEKAKTANKDVPVFVLTNLSQEESLTRAEALGATRCYVKAKVSLNEVIDEIEKTMKK